MLGATFNKSKFWLKYILEEQKNWLQVDDITLKPFKDTTVGLFFNVLN